MKITVIEFDDTETRAAKEGLTKLKHGVAAFARDLRDHRVDADIVTTFVHGLRAAADYFEKHLKDDTIRLDTDIDVEVNLESEHT